MKNKKTNLILTISFFLLSFIPLICLIFNINSKNYSATKSIKFPKLIDNNKINKNFTKEFDDYWSSEFPLNTFLVSNYDILVSRIFKDSVNNKVIYGKEGFLYFSDTLDDIFKIESLSDSQIDKIVHSLQLQKEYINNLGKDFYFVVAPNKSSIYPEYLPKRYSNIGKLSNYERLQMKAKNLISLNLNEVLSKNKSENYYLYHKLDSHWNSLGAYKAYEQIMNLINIDPIKITSSKSIKNWHGDLSKMFYPDRVVLDEQFEMTTEFNYRELRPMITKEDLLIHTRGNGNKNLLMYRDSFAIMLIDYISPVFNETIYLKEDTNDYRKLNEFNTDIVLFEIVERNLNWLLQKTPIMPALETNPINSDILIKKNISININKQKDMYFLNAKFNDPKDNNIEKIIIKSSDKYYEAFNVYQDDDIRDGIIYNGFSMYLKEKYDDIEIFLLEDNVWKKLKIN